MKLTLSCSAEKWLRSFDKRIPSASPLARFTAAEDTRFLGRRRGDHFILYRRRRGIFPLLATTLYGRLTQSGDRATLRLFAARPRVAVALFSLWGLLLLWAGGALVFTETLFSLVFLIPGIAVLLFALIPSPKEKALLLEEVKKLSEERLQ